MEYEEVRARDIHVVTVSLSTGSNKSGGGLTHIYTRFLLAHMGAASNTKWLHTSVGHDDYDITNRRLLCYARPEYYSTDPERFLSGIVVATSQVVLSTVD